MPTTNPYLTWAGTPSRHPNTNEFWQNDPFCLKYTKFIYLDYLQGKGGQSWDGIQGKKDEAAKETNMSEPNGNLWVVHIMDQHTFKKSIRIGWNEK